MEEALALLTRGWIRILIQIVTTMGCAKSTRIEFTLHHCYIIIILSSSRAPSPLSGLLFVKFFPRGEVLSWFIQRRTCCFELGTLFYCMYFLVMETNHRRWRFGFSSRQFRSST